MAGRITKERVGQMVKAVLQELQDAGGEARLRDIFAKVEPKLNLSEYEKESHAKSGYLRRRSVIHFYSIDCVKAGYLKKSGGRWYLTEEGRQALKKPAEDFISTAMAKYRAWKKAQPAVAETDEVDEEETDKIVRQTAYEQAVAEARAEIESHINALGAYDFQKLVGELLMGMGYYVPFIASPGPDGGIDLVAHKDPLGTTAPRIKVQVKHRQHKVAAKEVRELEALLRKEGDIGLIVSSGGFTSDAERELRSSTRHIETMDLERLITLWQEHYEKMREQGKTLLPLVRLYFLAPPEE